MYIEIVNGDDALRLAFEKACIELCVASAEVERREQLALVMLTIVKDGERDASIVRRRAITIMRQSRL
jgi:hypothetical protein